MIFFCCSSLHTMSGKLIFSFGFGMDQASLTTNPVICFSASFYLFKVTTNSFIITSIHVGIVRVGTKPILQFDLWFDVEFASLKGNSIMISTPRSYVAWPTIKGSIFKTTLSVSILIVSLVVASIVCIVLVFMIVVLVHTIITTFTLDLKGKAILIPKFDLLHTIFKISSSLHPLLLIKS